MADEKSNTWWATFPGLLTATAGVLTAVTGLLVVLGQLGVIGGNKPVPTGSDPPSSSQPATTAAPLPPVLSPSPPAPSPSPPFTTKLPTENPSVEAQVKWSEVDFGPVLGKGRLYVKPPQGRAGDDFEIGGVGFPALYTILVKHLSVGLTGVATDVSGSFTMTLSTEPTLCTDYTIEIRELSTLKLFGTTTYTTTGC
jgi:hypothetical protein